MKIIRNEYIPLGKFDCMNILGFLFVREEVELEDYIIRHEATHTLQQLEILVVSALVALIASNIYQSWWYALIVILMPIAIYVLAWLVEAILPPYDTAYRDSPFEREAYMNQHNPEYNSQRSWWAWCGYVLKKRKK